MNTDILNLDYRLKYDSYPKNVYAIRIKDKKGNQYDIACNHNGYCPQIETERDSSRFNDYLSNLESSVVKEFFDSIKKTKPKVYSTKLEIMTDEKGNIFHLAKTIN